MNLDTEIKILIVDDSPDSLGMLNDVLSNAGMTVLVALGGKQALNICEQITPDIILLDAVMPEIDGFEVCKKIKEKKASIPIIFMTGLTSTEDIVRGLETGAVDYVTKPINNDEMLARVRVHVHNARNHISAKIALEVAGQSIIAVDQIGNIVWATNRAQDQLDKYANTPDVLTKRLANSISNVWNKAPNENILLEGFGDSQDEKVSVTYLNALGPFHLIRLSGSSEQHNLKQLIEQLPVTQREAEVLLWLSRGKSNWEIATILTIKPRTINKHLEQIFKKLSVDNRTAAAALALEALSNS